MVPTVRTSRRSLPATYDADGAFTIEQSHAIRKMRRSGCKINLLGRFEYDWNKLLNG
jgi:hypothetical protein